MAKQELPIKKRAEALSGVVGSDADSGKIGLSQSCPSVTSAAIGQAHDQEENAEVTFTEGKTQQEIKHVTRDGGKAITAGRDGGRVTHKAILMGYCRSDEADSISLRAFFVKS